MATYVRDRKAKTLEEATGLADDFVVNRGWAYEVLLRQISLPTKESSTERMTGLFIQENRRLKSQVNRWKEDTPATGCTRIWKEGRPGLEGSNQI